MSDHSVDTVIKEINRLKKEVVDAHNMSIKTDTNMHNLYAEMKRITDNQQMMFRSNRFHSWVAYVLFVVIIGTAAILVANAHANSLRDRNNGLQATVDTLQAEVTKLTKNREEYKAAEVQAWALWQALKEGNRKDAIRQYQQMNRAPLGKTLLAMFDRELAVMKVAAAESHYKEGVNLYRVGNYTNAVRELKAALELAPDFPNATMAHYYLGFTYFKLKKSGETIAELELAVKDAPEAAESPRARYTIGLAMEMGGNKEEAMHYYKQAVKVRGKNPYRKRMWERISDLAGAKKAKKKKAADTGDGADE